MPEKKISGFMALLLRGMLLYYTIRMEKSGLWIERSYKLNGLGYLTNSFPNSVENWQAEIGRIFLNCITG